MNYLKLFLMTLLSFACMYTLMYSMVNEFANVYTSLNQFYMAAIMTLPMIVIELAIMSHMYTNKITNSIIIAFSITTFLVLFTFIRKQIAINDKEFLKSMIPHHAGALLMCKNNNLKDPQVQNLCKNITKSQQEEIDFMRSKLNVN